MITVHLEYDNMEKPDIVAELIDSYLNDEFLPSVV